MVEYRTIIGLAAAALTAFSYFPQLIKIIREKETKDIALGMYVMLAIGFLLWLVYGILQGDIVIIAANSIAIAFSTSILLLKLRYK